MKAMDTATARRKGVTLRATVIYRKDGEVLFVRKRNSKWNLPAGRVERNETPLRRHMERLEVAPAAGPHPALRLDDEVEQLQYAISARYWA